MFLNIAGAFPNAVTARLLANMVRLGYPTQLISFFEAVLADRQTVLSFDGYVSEAFEIDNGIGQGEPSSMILYLIYSHALVGIPPTCGGDGGHMLMTTFSLWLATHSRNVTQRSIQCWTSRKYGQWHTTRMQSCPSSGASHSLVTLTSTGWTSSKRDPAQPSSAPGWVGQPVLRTINRQRHGNMARVQQESNRE